MKILTKTVLKLINKHLYKLCLIFIMINSLNCRFFTIKNDLIILKNKNIEVGILPEVGGRVVLLRIPGYENILKSDSTLWINSKTQKPKISAFSDFKAFDGHIVWVGPQNEWWTHQDINKNRKKTASVWPPDPYVIYGKFNIIARTDSSIKMVGPDSPISGIKLFKEVSIKETGEVKFTVTMENITQKNVKWDLWMNTRLDGYANCYVPINKNDLIEFMHTEDNMKETTPYKIENDFFTLCPSLPKTQKKQQVQEVHINPSQGYISAFNKNQMLLIWFKKNPKNKIHPLHGQVELYSSISHSGFDRLLELEMHGVYSELKPGETKSLSETWKIFPYDGDINSKSQIKYLKEILRNSLKIEK